MIKTWIRSLGLALILFAVNTQAKITFQTPANHSTHNFSLATPTIYGGIAGSCAATTDVCDSCAGTTLTACNPRKISSSTILKINFSSDTTAGIPYLMKTDNDTKLNTTDVEQSVAKGATATVTISWNDVCAYMTTNPLSVGGTATGNTTLRVGLKDAAGTIQEKTDIRLVAKSLDAGADTEADGGPGVHTFVAYPGDGKVYIEDINGTDTDFATDSAGEAFRSIKVYYSNTDFTVGPGSGSGSAEILLQTATGSENATYTNTVDNLTNGLLYHFRIGMEDLAGNIGYFTADGRITASGTCTAGDPASVDAGCPYMAKPEKVYGLLEEDFNCFISTAAYGSALAPQVQTFREFRNRYLLTTAWGRAFIKKYYEWGPYGARAIAKNEIWRAVTRVFLWPLWLESWMAVRYGLVASILMTLGLLSFSVGCYLSWLRRSTR